MAVASGPQTCQLLYDRIKMETERQTGEIRRALVGSGDEPLMEGQEEHWMEQFQREGKQFLDQVLLVRSIFLYLDRTYVLSSAELLSIWCVLVCTCRHELARSLTPDYPGISDSISSDTRFWVILRWPRASQPASCTLCSEKGKFFYIWSCRNSVRTN